MGPVLYLYSTCIIKYDATLHPVLAQVKNEKCNTFRYDDITIMYQKTAHYVEPQPFSTVGYFTEKTSIAWAFLQ